MTDLAGRVFAKTGYIGGVRSLSGYVKTGEGKWLVFSIIYNGIPGDVKPYEELQDQAVRLLAEWPKLSSPREAAPSTQPATAGS
jgi:D-alanyl-D-alanine carboxypeptidase/D-alanyl-D-alanine-endopeptidase (penicillin-binding protein 4)